MANKWHDLYKRSIKAGVGGGTQVKVGDIKKIVSSIKRKNRSKGGSAKGKK